MTAPYLLKRPAGGAQDTEPEPTGAPQDSKKGTDSRPSLQKYRCDK